MSPRRPPRRLAVATRLAASLVLAAWPAVSDAQRRPAPEFTRQGLLILGFDAGEGATRKVAKDAADEVRDRMERHVNEREVQLLGGRGTVQQLELMGVRMEGTPDRALLEYVAKQIRADEYVVARVERRGGATRILGELYLTRDRTTRQPLPVASAPELDAAAEQFARALAATRAQLAPQRRCENAIRDGRFPQALAAAREGAAAVPRGAFVRACLVNAMAVAGTPAGERLAAARELLSIDSLSQTGLAGAARAYDLLKQRDEAAAMWLRLAATAPEDPALAIRVINALLEGGSARHAEALVTRVASEHPDNMEVLRLKWQVFHETRKWDVAVGAGESLFVKDTLARTDSTFLARLAAANRSAGRIVRAVELAAHGVARFPGDARLYGVYAQLVRAESDSVVPRGLAQFPNSADLHALAAQVARAKGNTEAALEATRRAVALDSTLPQGVLSIAQAEFDLGRPDSALATLGRAVARGEDSTLVAQFALAKGNALLRAANQTKIRADYERAMRFFALADSVRSSVQSKFLLGTAALNVSRAALDDAPKAYTAGAKEEGCALARLGAVTLASARDGLTAGQELAPDAARQYLGYVEQLSPFAERQVSTFCSPT